MITSVTDMIIYHNSSSLSHNVTEELLQYCSHISHSFIIFPNKVLYITSTLINYDGGGLAQMVECLLMMQEVPGLILGLVKKSPAQKWLAKQLSMKLIKNEWLLQGTASHKKA